MVANKLIKTMVNHYQINCSPRKKYLLTSISRKYMSNCRKTEQFICILTRVMRNQRKMVY